MTDSTSTKNTDSGLFLWLKKNKLRIVLTLIVVIILGLSLFGYNLYDQIYRTEINIPENNQFVIESGEGAREVANRLTEKGVIDSPLHFIIYSFVTNNHKNLQAGKYILEDDLTIVDLMEKFNRGDVVTYRMTVVEGWTLRDVANRVEAIELGSSEDLFDLTGLSSPQAELLDKQESSSQFSNTCRPLVDKPTDVSLEGYIYPDTYEISAGGLEEFLKLATDNFCRKISEEKIEKAKNKNLNVHELITFASLLEREVPEREERRKVADILWRRKEAGIPLQVDMTVNYVTGRKDINVTLEETEINSPYNTYQIKGLPEGPIGNPSLESIEAVLNPKENDYWYYLSDPKTRETIFSKTHLEHIRAKNKYLR